MKYIDITLKDQLIQYLNLLEGNIIINFSKNDSMDSNNMELFLNDLLTITDKIKIQEKSLSISPSFSINKENEITDNIIFAGIPLGHEFSSLILALLHKSGRKPNIDDKLIHKIKNFKTNEVYKIETIISLSCHNCPDVVQAFNIMAALNSSFYHTMIDGAFNKKIIEERDVLAVPSVYLNNSFNFSGKLTLEEIINKIIPDNTQLNENKIYDTLIIGGGPAGSSAAIYLARKGLDIGIISQRFGGQVLDTMSIENLIGTEYTDGPKLVKSLENHVKNYPVEIINTKTVESINKNDNIFELNLNNGNTLKAKTVLISTGAKWRELNIPGENEFKNKGVAYCPHCDGPLFANKPVAVIGGGNSGVEAAIDLSAITKHVYLLEYGNSLKADQVLIDKAKNTKNITIITNAQSQSIVGKNKVESLTYKNLLTNEIESIVIDGIFVQIGLLPNTNFLSNTLELNKFKEIVIDKHGNTSVNGIFAAGDCTDIPFKQIIIAMGEGAKTGLSIFNYLIKN